MDALRGEHVTTDRRDAEQRQEKGEEQEKERQQDELESGSAGMDSEEKEAIGEIRETEETEETGETRGTEDTNTMMTTTTVANESTTMATLSKLRHEADVIEDDVRRLISILKVVNQSLTSRTSDAAMLTSSHARTTRDVSHVALAATTRLDAITRKFLQNITRLRQNFRTITALSQATSQVRAQVLRLETQVARL